MIDPNAPLRLERWPLDRLLPSARNARTHSATQVAEIAGSVRTFGFANPLLVDERGSLIAGHGRLAAARQLGMSEVPVIVLAGLTDVERRQLMLADNRIAANAGWDFEMLRLELTELSELKADLSVLGFSKKELAQALTPANGAGLTDEDEIPILGDRAVTEPGDLWLLGPHCVLCGDSTVAEDVQAVLGELKPNLMVTDPPYGVAYDPTWRHRAGVNKSKRTGAVQNDERADWSAAWANFPGSIAYVWHGALHATTVAESLLQNGFVIRSQIIWAKERLVIGRGDYHWRHEPCWYAVRGTGNWTGDRKQTTLWEIGSGGQDEETQHGTQKPVECMRRPILNNSSSGEPVFEPFLGSGTTLIAAEATGRICTAIEIDPRYVDVAVRRWEKFTGQQARLKTGESFADVEQKRADTTPSGAVPPQTSVDHAR
jgi:DNA modification methylase